MQSGENHRQHENQRGNIKIIPQCTAFYKTLYIFLQNLKCVDATVIEICFFNRIVKKKMKKKEDCDFVKITCMNITHILHQITWKFL